MKFDDTPRNYRLYVLELEGGKYYVGITSKTAEERMLEHQHGIKPAYWTNKYKPIRVDHVQELGVIKYSEAEKLEQEATQKYMKQYGLNNVRGGELRS